MTEIYNYFAVCPRGLEAVVARELKNLQAKDIMPERAGVSFSGDLKLGYKANLWLRSAVRVLCKIKEFPAHSEAEFYENVVAMHWENHLSIDHTLAVTANINDSFLTHSQFAALKTKDAVVDRFMNKYERRPNVDRDSPDVHIYLNMNHNHCTLSLNMSGESLHQRGYRRQKGEAPLKEALAAGIVLLTGYDGSQIFIDAMCGSGTLPIEAALIARNFAPGLLRQNFGFQRWPNHDADLWQNVVAEAQDNVCRPATTIFGSDISSQIVGFAKENARRAGVRPWVKFSQKDMFELTSRGEGGVIICNPPYGERMGEIDDVRGLYTEIGNVFKRRFTGNTGYIFTGNPELLKSVGLKTKQKHVLYNGQLESRLAEYALF